jgi:DNA polymerase III delta subunit
LNITDFLSTEKKDKYIFIGNNQLTDKLIKEYLGDYEISAFLPKGGLLRKNRLLKNPDLLSSDFSKLEREYKFVIQVDKKDGRRKIFKTADKEEIVDTTIDANEDFIKNQIITKLGITKRQAEKITKHKKDVGSIYNEVQRLQYLNRTEKNNYIEQLEITKDNDIFIFINALFENNNYMKYLNRLNEHPIKLLYMIAQQLRGLIICKEQKGNIAKDFSLHPYQVKIFKKQARTYSKESLMTMFKTVNEYNRKIKTGKISPELALDYICSYIYTRGGG